MQGVRKPIAYFRGAHAQDLDREHPLCAVLGSLDRGALDRVANEHFARFDDVSHPRCVGVLVALGGAAWLLHFLGEAVVVLGLLTDLRV